MRVDTRGRKHRAGQSPNVKDRCEMRGRDFSSQPEVDRRLRRRTPRAERVAAPRPHGVKSERTGAVLDVVVPSPNWPWALLPQQKTCPSATIPQVCELPSARVVNVTPPVTATGVVEHGADPHPFGPVAPN